VLVRVSPLLRRPGALASVPACQRIFARRFGSDGLMQIKTPDFGAESITEGTLIEWNKKVGDFIDAGEILGVIETDKVSVEIKAEISGIVQELKVSPDETVAVGQLLAVIQKGAVAPAKKVEAAASLAAPSGPAATPAAPLATAPTASAASEFDVTADVIAIRSGLARPERRVKMTRMRQRIAARLKESQNSTAMLTTFQEVDMSGILNLRKDYKESFEVMHGVKLGFMSVFAKASAFALQQIPSINAVIDDDKKEIIYRDYVDISVAVSSPRGLVVPVLRNVESMSMADVESSIGKFAGKAKRDELTIDEMTGGTFTISNGGVFGSMMGTPIINPPQSAILGMHATKMRPVVLKNGEVGIRPIMYLALTYDHRLVDGREGVTFLCIVRDLIEDPRRLLLEV